MAKTKRTEKSLLLKEEYKRLGAKAYWEKYA